MARVASEIERGADHVLHGKSHVRQVVVIAYVDRLQVVQQARSVEPGRTRAPLHHVVAQQRADRNEVQVANGKLAGKTGKIAPDGFKHVLAEIDQVHLVHRRHHVGNPQQRGDVGMAAGLRQHAVTGVDQYDGEVGGGGAGGHVARILLVAGRIGDDELPLGRGEIAVGDIDGDALFPLSSEAVGQQGEVDRSGGLVHRRFTHGGDLVLIDSLGIEQQPADQGGLAIVHTARGRKPQQLLFLILPEEGIDIRDLKNASGQK